MPKCQNIKMPKCPNAKQITIKMAPGPWGTSLLILPTATGEREDLRSIAVVSFCSDWCLSLVFVGFNLLILCWLAGANDEVHSFKFNPYFLTFETLGIFDEILTLLSKHALFQTFHVLFSRKR